MLAVVKKPHIELAISGENVEELMQWISKKYELEILDMSCKDNELVPIEDTIFYKEMQKNRVGNLLAGARHKKGFTQKELAKKAKIKQNMVSEYESGKRQLSKSMATKLSRILDIRIPITS